jgi:hypothetical protein
MKQTLQMTAVLQIPDAIRCADQLKTLHARNGWRALMIFGAGAVLSVLLALMVPRYLDYYLASSGFAASIFFLIQSHRSIMKVPCRNGHTKESGHQLKYQFRKGELEIYCGTCGEWFDTDCRILYNGGPPVRKLK